MECYVTAIYDRVTLDLYNIQFDVTTEVDGVYEIPKSKRVHCKCLWSYDTDTVIVIKEARCYALRGKYSRERLSILTEVTQ